MQIYFNAVKSSYIVYHNIQAIKTEKSYAYSRINYNKFKHKLNIRCYRYINIYLNMKKKENRPAEFEPTTLQSLYLLIQHETRAAFRIVAASLAGRL